MKRLLLLVLSLYGTITFAQNLSFQKIINTHTTSTQLATLSETEQKESGVILSNIIYVEYAFDSTDDFRCYQGILKRVKINDNKSLEMYNKIVLPVPNTNDLLYLKARSISKTGMIKEVGLEAVKELEEQGRVYKIVAVEGLETGGELEYITLFRRSSSMFGSEILQSEIPVRQSELKIISPAHLLFEAKVYNAPANIKLDTLNNKNTLTVGVNHLLPLIEEKYAHLKANLVRADYKVAYNLTMQKDERLYTWQSAAETFFNYLKTGEDESQKEVMTMLTKEKIKGLPPEIAIRKLENYIKINIAIKEEEEADIAADVLKKQYASKAGIMRLFVASLDALKIPYEIVVGVSRAEAYFDKEFDSWNFLDEYLLYFPQTKKYLDPSTPLYRYGMIDQYMEGNNALFIQSKKEGKEIVPVAIIKQIPFSTIADNNDNLQATINFSPTLDQIQGQIIRSMTGHQAAQVRPYFHYIKSEEDRKNLTNEIIKSTLKPDVTYTNAQVKNTNLATEAEKPFIISADINLKSIIEKAGKKYLFKVGEIIGPQVEMYNERPRQYDIDMGNAHAYKRIIKVQIPTGYKLSGFETIKRSITDGKAEPTMGFISDYKMNNNLLTITIDEFYKQVTLPVGEYAKFQEVINAAADFNKVTLILEKI